MKDLKKMYDELMSSNSKLDKLTILKKYPQNKTLLFYIYHPQYIYGVTSANLQKNIDLETATSHTDIITLLDSLRKREITGNAALSEVNGFIAANSEYKELIYKIIDRNLKAQIGVTEINKVWTNLIPVFKVQLADLYISEAVAENSKKLAKQLKATKIDFSKNFYSSRKCDGLRCITLFDEDGEPTCWSRRGKEFLTLDKLKDSLRTLPLSVRKNRVLDGELCIVDENGDEDFKAISKVYNKKDYTIENPHYKVFDILTAEEFNSGKGTTPFSKRYAILQSINFDKTFATVLEQTLLTSQKHLDLLAKAAVDSDWEGLIVRKDVGYSAKRSKDMLKVKPFFDAEFKILSIENTTKNMLNEDGVMAAVTCMGTASIEFKGNTVWVGSGWSDEERVAYAKNPQSIIGKEMTVRYTEESEDEEGNPSLRFPRKKIVHEGGRDC